MKAKHITVWVATLLVLLSSCATSNVHKEPSWVANLYDKQYPKESYLCSIGSGQSREEAVNNAFSALAQSINATIRSEITTISTSVAQTEKGTTTFSDSDAMQSWGSVSSVIDQMLGSEVVNTWVDASSLVWVRLAVNKKNSAALYQQQLRELESQIAHLKAQAAFKTPLEHLLLLHASLKLAKEHQQLASIVRALGQKEEGNLLSSIQQEIQRLSSTVQLQVEVQVGETVANKSSAERDLKQAWYTLLSSIGIVSVPEASFAIKIFYDASVVSSIDAPYVQVRYTLGVSLVEQEVVIASALQQQRISALSQVDAYKRALADAIDSSTALLEEVGLSR
ncbi:MAG: LPP20 family lipoprotein [Sphaerochaetaceae bacterium]